MKKFLLACILLSIANNSKADDLALVAHGFSKHLENHNFNEKNYGIALRFEHDDYGLQTGTYHNSLNKTSVYTGIDWSPLQHKTNSCVTVEAGPFYGFVTGYKYTVTPVVGLQSAIRCNNLYSRIRVTPDPFYNSKAFGAVEIGFVFKKF